MIVSKAIDLSSRVCWCSRPIQAGIDHNGATFRREEQGVLCHDCHDKTHHLPGNRCRLFRRRRALIGMALSALDQFYPIYEADAPIQRLVGRLMAAGFGSTDNQPKIQS
jgi:hypothetical protein